MKSDLDLAKQLNVPVLIHVDTENWLPESLLNWHDPKKPGFDPAKVAHVEWYGWTPDTAVKLCWRNWGQTVRVRPADWPDVHMPREEYLDSGKFKHEDRFPTPAIFPGY